MRKTNRGANGSPTWSGSSAASRSSLTIIGFTRRKPPLEVEFLRREEAETRLQGLSNKIDALRAEMRADLASVAVEMRASDKATADQLQSIFERLGQLRGVK
ncbi:MAG: hypothetical protein M5U15_13620 [Kiritimatiellae bacterium]|nr:hypothetical protein [Kiritimatiellia bacterium]